MENLSASQASIHIFLFGTFLEESSEVLRLVDSMFGDPNAYLETMHLWLVFR